MIIDNATAAAVRADLNLALAAIVQLSSGATEPATKYAYQLWADTTSGYLKQRNAANSAWITLWQLSAGTIPAAGSTGITTLGTITTGAWNAGMVTATYSGMGVGAVIGANNDAGGYGLMGISTVGTGALISSSSGRGLLASTILGVGATINVGGTQTAATANAALEVTRNHATAGYSTTGDLISVTDYPTGAGTVSGSLLKATIDSTIRTNFNPRVTDGASAKAYLMDTKNALSTAGAELLAVSNNGTEQFAVAHNGAIKLKTGANKSIGQATLVGGTVTVSNTAITANSRIFVTVSTTGGTRGYLSVTKSAGVSFTITSSSGTDTSVVDYMIVESMA